MLTKNYNSEGKNLTDSDIDKLRDRYLSLRSINFTDIYIKNYTLIEIIGVGGFGIVFKAYSKIQNKYVALKFLDPETTAEEDSYKRVIREINNAQKIKDKRIVSIYSIENWDGIIFLVMEFYEGETLKEYLSDKENYNWEDFKPIFLEILEGVKALHDNHIIHRDIKPSNIFITKDDQVVLLDFGLSKKLDENDISLTVDKMLGTINYMSPEQLSPEKGIDYSSDIYQLGLILYVVIFSKLPYEGDTASIMTKKLYSNPEFPVLPDFKLPKYLKFGIGKALERESTDRFKSISEMIDYFEEEHYPFLGSTLQLIKKRPKATVFAIFALILMITLGYLYISKNDRIGRVEYNGSNLKVYNPFGIKLYERNFEQEQIKYATKYYLGFLSTAISKQLNKQNTVLVFLEPQEKNIYPDFQSNMDDSFKSRIVLIDKNNEIVHKFNSNYLLKNNFFYDFSKSFRFNIINELDSQKKRKPEIIFTKKHNFGMFPTSLNLIYEKGNFSFFNPGQFLYYNIIKENDKYTFILHGINNIICHLNFFSEAIPETEQNFIPNLHIHKHINKKKILVFLPDSLKLSKDRWFEKEEFIEFNSLSDGNIIKVFKTHEIEINTGEETYSFKDRKVTLDRIYNNIDDYYRTKILKKDYKAASLYIQTALKNKLENPWLRSALLYFQGDLKIREGRLKEGLTLLKESLKSYSNNTTSFQRICEVSFLLNEKEKLFILLNNSKYEIYRFFGLPYGKNIFKIYTYLHFGDFFKAERIVNKMVFMSKDDLNKKRIIRGNTLLKAIEYIYSGKYSEAVLFSESLRGKNLSPFTLNEYRLIYSRAAILSSIFGKKLKKNIIMDLSRFYIDDISINSITTNHLADISRAYFFAKNGEFLKAETLLDSGHKELLKMNKGDFFTRFWFFYDTFMYGKTMELLGNKSEAIKGYKASIKVNPHTDLAKRAKKLIEEIL